MSLKLKNLKGWSVQVFNTVLALLLISPGASGNTSRVWSPDTAAYLVRKITVHGEKMTGYIRGGIFYLVCSSGKIILKSGEGCYSWEFEDFDGDGFKDIYVEFLSNTPDEADLYLYQPSTGKFVYVEDFLDFPAAERINGTPYFYSYHRSGCADQDWDSDIFCLRDFKAVRLGNISGVGCADKEEERVISISKIRGDSLMLIQKFPISIINKYRYTKWGFIKQYWYKNYRLFRTMRMTRHGK